MAESPIQAESESDITPAAEETLDAVLNGVVRSVTEALKIKGNDEYRKYKFDSAIFFYTEGIKMNCKDEQLMAKLYCNRAIAYFYMGDYNNSLIDAKVAIDLQPSYVKAIERGSKACVLLNQFKEAITWCDKGLAIEKDNQKLLELRSLSVEEQSRLHDTDGEKEISTDVSDKAGKIGTSGNPGNFCDQQQDFKRNVSYYERQLKIAKLAEDWVAKANAYNHLGQAYFGLADYKKAMDCFEHFLKFAKQAARTTAAEGNAYLNIGKIHHILGNCKTAIDYHERGLKIAKELNDRSDEMTAYLELGIVYHRHGDFKTAIDYHERGLQIAKELGNRSVMAKTYGNLGNAHHSFGDFKTAKCYHERSLKLFKQLGNRTDVGIAYGNLGRTHFQLGDIESAVDCHKHDLEITKDVEDKSGEGSAYGSLGTTDFSLGDFKSAIANHERALKVAKELGERWKEAQIYAALGADHAGLGDIKTAIDCFIRRLKIAEELGDRLGVASSKHNLGIFHEFWGSVSEAVECYRSSVATFNDIRDSLHFNDKWKIILRNEYQVAYDCLWRALLKQGKVIEALFSAEQGRAQALKDLLETKYAFETTCAGSRTMNPTTLDMLSWIPSNTVFIALNKVLSQEVVFWVCQKGKDVKLIRKQITDDSTQDVVTPYFQSLVQVVSQEIGARVDVKCEDRSLDRAVDNLNERSPTDKTQTPSLNPHKSALSTLYDTIINPIAKDLILGNEITFVPVGPLCLAPFPAFMDSNSKYLFESYRVRVIPSLTSLKLIMDCRAEHHSKSGALLVGDPWIQEVVYLGKKLPQLSCARMEVEIIGQIINTSTLIGTEATKDEVLKRLSSVALVHIAAHGRMETGEIVLAPNPTRTSRKPEEKDYLLKMEDVLSVQLQAKLVVLSCCHSARGEIKAEGVVGIARAFLGAGARSVLVSLWAIDDKATLEFMKSFYQHLAEGKSASEALNQTRKYMKEFNEFSAVKYWAPFVLIGDDVTIEFGGHE